MKLSTHLLMGVLCSTLLLLLSGCSSIDTSQRLSLVMSAKSNPVGTDTVAKYSWTDKPYITPIHAGLSALPMKGKFVRLNIGDEVCGKLKLDNNAIQDDNAADVLIDATWQNVGSDKLLTILNGLQDRVHVPSVKAISTPPTKIQASQVIAGAIVAPIYLAVGVIAVPLYLLTGEAFKDQEPRDIEKRKAFISDRLITSDNTVSFALLNVRLTNRKEQLLFPVSTPSLPEDWESPLDYVLLFAIDAPDNELGRMGLCGIPAKRQLPPLTLR